MVDKIRRIRDDNITAQDVAEIKKGESDSSSEADESSYVDGNSLPNIFRQSNTRRFAHLTSKEEREIDEDLQPLAGAIALYNSDETCEDLPMNEFVCLVVELEEARRSHKL
ncbi:MAG: hypothetical protein ABH859_05850 [Pseudomonadota bacterium]